MNSSDAKIYIYRDTTIVHIYEGYLIKLTKDKWITMTDCGLKEIMSRIDMWFLTKE